MQTAAILGTQGHVVSREGVEPALIVVYRMDVPACISGTNVVKKWIAVCFL